MRDARLGVREASKLTWSDIERVRGGTGRVRVRSTGEPEHRIISSDTVKLLSSIRRGAGDDHSVLGLSSSQIAVRIRDAASQAGLGEGFNGDSPRQGMIRDLETLGVLLLGEQVAINLDCPKEPPLQALARLRYPHSTTNLSESCHTTKAI